MLWDVVLKDGRVLNIIADWWDKYDDMVVFGINDEEAGIEQPAHAMIPFANLDYMGVKKREANAHA